jgi:tetratricopeptide (TPR) repeat protein/transglutaminase-like putative cysteine protease
MAPLPSLAQVEAPEKAALPPQDYSKEAYVIQRSHVRLTPEADGTGTRELAAEVKIYADAGVKAFAVLNFTYTSANETVDVDYVRVHKADGSVIDTPNYNIQDMPADITRTAPVYSDIHEKHVAVKGLAVGDVLEYQIRYRVLKPQIPGHFWYEYSFMKDSIIKDERLDLSVPKEKYVNVVSPEIKPDIKEEGARRVFRWTSSNLERKEKDPNEIPKRTPPNPSVQVTTFATWEDLGRWFGSLQKNSLKITPAIQAKAAELTKGLNSDDAKILAIYNYVSLRFHYIGLDFGIGRFQPHPADEVLGNEYGDCKDKHTLLAALLLAVGYEAWPALIHSVRKLDPNVPSPAQFDHVVTVIPVGEKLTWVDTTPEVAPYGMLLAVLRDKQALVIPSDKPPILMKTPVDPPFPQEQRFSMEAKLASDGTLTGHVEQTYRGDIEVALRAAFRQVPPAQWDELMQGFSYRLGFGGDVSKVHTTPPDETERPLHISYEYLRENYSDWEHSRITPPLPPLGVEVGDEKDVKKPSEPLILGAPGEIVYHSKLQFPPGYFIERPKNCDLVETYAEYHAANEFQNGQLTTSRRFVIKKSQVTVAEWGAYQKFGKAVNDDEFTFISLRFPSGDRPSGSAAAADHFRRGWELHEKGDLDGAIGEYRAALQLNPNDAQTHSNLGLVLKGKGDMDGAIAEYRAALQLNPNDAQTHSHLGVALKNKGDLDGAITEYRAGLGLKPDDADTHYNLGNALRLKGDLDAAIAEYRAALWLEPDDAEAHTALGTALSGKGDMDGAIAEYRTALRWNPDDADTHYDLANALRLIKGDLDASIVEYRAALRLNPDDADTHSNLGLALWGKGNLDAAIAELKAGIRLKPDYARAHYLLGSLLEGRGDVKAALEEYRSASKLEPNDGDFRKAYENLSLRLKP